MERKMLSENTDAVKDMGNLVETGNVTVIATSSPVLQYTSFTLSVLTCVIGLVGNSTVIWVTGFIVKEHKCKVWFLNLAIADLVFLLCLPLNAVAVLTENWPFGPYLCKIYNFISTCNMYASIFTITALNIDRVLSVAHPMWHLKFFSIRICYWTCAFIWAITFLASLPVMVLTSEYKNGEKTVCALLTPDHNSSTHTIVKSRNIHSPDYEMPNVGTAHDIFPDPPYYKSCVSLPDNSVHCKDDRVITEEMWNQMTFSIECLLVPFLVVGYFIPLCVILCSNIIIAQQVNHSQTVKSSRLYKIIITVVLFFFLTWTPLITAEVIYLTALHAVNIELMDKVYVILPLLASIAYSNSCLNPIIYVLIGRQVRGALTNVMSTIKQNFSTIYNNSLNRV
ncbi:chemerin-like receptor 1 [Rhinophrynus dorsalis]